MPSKHTIEIDFTAPTSDLGRAVSRELAQGQPLRITSGKARRVLVNLHAQPPNTLLHDGHAWRRQSPARIVGDTQRVLEDPAHGDAGYIVHASYAFLRAAESSARLGEALRPIVEAATEAERIVLADSRPSCVVRLGYQYGPGSRDLKRYRTAFRLRRPYWAGPGKPRHDFLHHADAAMALLTAARTQPPGEIYYATDGIPIPFITFMDDFARLVGNRHPLHIPGWSRIFARTFIGDEHMEMVEMGVRGAPTRVLPGFAPQFPDYRQGLADSVNSWR